MIKIWPLLLVIGLGLATFLIGANFRSDQVNLLSTAALLSTLAAVIWYTIETRGLRLQQQFDSEIRNHPWLTGSNLKVDWDKNQGGLLGRYTIYLPISNVGTTPANDLHVNVKWYVRGKEPHSGENSITGLILTPTDTGHLKLCEIDFEAPGDQVTIDAEITYRSFMGGGGRLKMNFYSHEIILQPVTKGYFRSLVGVFKSKTSMTKALLRERARDKKREEAKFNELKKISGSRN